MSTFNFIVVLLVGFLDHMGIGLVYPLFASLLFDPDANIVPANTSATTRGFLLGILMALTPLLQFFSAPILGAMSDKKGRKYVLRLGISIGCIGYAIAVCGIWFGSLALLFLYRAFVGVADGTVAVAQASIADMSNEQNKSKRFSWFSAVLGLGFTVGPFIGGKVSDPSVGSWCGYATPFILTGLLCLLNLLLITKSFPESKIRKEDVVFNPLEGMKNIVKAFTWMRLRVLYLATFAFAFGWSFFNEFIPVLLKAKFAFTASETGDYFAYCGLWYALSSGLLTQPILSRFPPEKVVIKSLWCCAIYMPLFLLLQEVHHIWLFMPFLMYLLAIIFPTSGALISNHGDSSNQGEILGLYHSVLGFSMGISPLFAGALVGAYPPITIWGGALAMAIAGYTYWLGERKQTANQTIQST